MQGRIVAVCTSKSKGERKVDVGTALLIEGLDLPALPVGTVLRVGEVVLKVSQIGKECHQGCAVMQAVGDCVMPREGIFATVEKGGRVSNGDAIEIIAHV